ncbi:AAA family ATPase [Clostridium sp. LQ25]|uniref:ATP-dependent DNA helicase n=1 Tax=Clostridium sp. LQ25 TaxID=2992805 RepID=UPI002253D4A6|nr:AAA family ATPase [Clostridium sp. LQ25]UZT06162.1 AAA family ATPase [Clostridium sp. LQ25]
MTKKRDTSIRKYNLEKHIRKHIKVNRKILKEASKDKVLRDIFNEDTLSILLRSYPDEIKQDINKLDVSNKKSIFNTIRKYRNKNFIDMMIKNAEIIVDEECFDYIKKIKNEDVDVFLQKNIYLLARYKTNLEKIKKLFMIDNYENTLLFNILKELHKNEENGHVYIERNFLYDKLRDKNNYAINDFNEAINKLIDKKIIIDDNCKIYFKELYEAECMLAKNLKQRLKLNMQLDNSICKKIDTFIKSNNINKDGKNAIYNVFQNNISIICGQAGTGKSTLINRIIKSINSISANTEDIKLLSYTGKAVSRLNAEDLDIVANTIHKFLGIKENDKFEIKLVNEKVDYLIIDEASMLDLKLMSVVLNSVPISARIILVGDIYQLQPIKAGSPFLDIFNSNLFAKTELTKIYRYSNKGIILNNALAIRNKDLKGIVEDEDFKILKYNSYTIFSDTMNEIDKLLKEQYLLEDIMILGTNNKLIDDMNKYISTQLNKNNLINGKRFNIADKVIQTKNNYSKDIYNGDTAIITSKINFNGQQVIKVKFDNKLDEVTYVNNEIDELNRAYALTIHKFQGSECKIIIIIIPNKTELYNSLLYVAVTRAREKVIVISNEKYFYNAINKSNPLRNGHLLERVQN